MLSNLTTLDNEIGLRRALGATRGHVAVQFLGEALLLGAIGGTGGIASALLIGGLAGLRRYANGRSRQRIFRRRRRYGRRRIAARDDLRQTGET